MVLIQAARGKHSFSPRARPRDFFLRPKKIRRGLYAGYFQAFLPIKSSFFLFLSKKFLLLIKFLNCRQAIFYLLPLILPLFVDSIFISFIENFSLISNIPHFPFQCSNNLFSVSLSKNIKFQSHSTHQQNFHEVFEVKPPQKIKTLA